MKSDTHEKTMRMMVRSVSISERPVDPSRKSELETIVRKANVPTLRPITILVSSYLLDIHIPRRGI